MSKRVRVQYFAVMREERGREVEDIETEAGTAGELYSMLQTEHGFSLPAHLVAVAVNGKLCSTDVTLYDGDEVVLLPPVAGG